MNPSLSGRMLLLPLLLLGTVHAQNLENRYSDCGNLYVLRLSTSPFPHPARSNGHTYNGTLYPADPHYNDSTVAVFVPRSFDAVKPFDLVVHIHGWRNNVDSVFAQFRIAEQLAASGRNAILVVPEGPKDAPDSFGGRLEEQGAFAAFIDDVVKALSGRDVIDENAEPGIVLSGHSGAFRMLSFILLRGGLTERIREVYLFDALYGQLEKYTWWLDHRDGRFVAIYTDSGGTKGTTESLMEDLDAWGIGYRMVEEGMLTDADLEENRVLFIHTDIGHNEVIAARHQFERYLRTGR